MVERSLLLVCAGLSVPGLLIAAVGLYGVYRGRKRRAPEGPIGERAATAVGDLAPGAVRVDGTAGTTGEDGTVEGPISGTEALVAHVEVQRLRGGSSTTRETVREDTEAVPFLVGDGTGQVRVDPPTGGEFDLDAEYWHVNPEQDPPGAVRRFVEANPGTAPGTGTGDGMWRYGEGLVVPGENVAVAGHAREAGDRWGEGGYVVDGGSDPGSFVLTDTPGTRGGGGGRRPGLARFGELYAVVVGLLFAAVPWLFLLVLVYVV